MTPDWNAIERSVLSRHEAALRATPQSPRWHAESDVYTHTLMTLDALVQLDGYRRLPPRQQLELRMAAALHDIGKPVTTDRTDPDCAAPRHGPVGARMARELLWREHALCGSADLQNIRETVCLLIRYHGQPNYTIIDKNAAWWLLRIAAAGELAPDFTVRLLCLLAEADFRGRECNDLDVALERIELCAELASDEGCLDGPYPFPSLHTQHAFMAERPVWKDQQLFDDTWGEVVMLCGLPGTGKDYWIAQHCAGMPVVSLDDLRRQLRVAPTHDQGRIVNQAKELARQHLRAHEPFVWNATNISGDTRRQLIALFESYHARVRLVYLETGWQEQQRRNHQREAVVPQDVIDRMLARLVPPDRHEATRVEWHCV